MTEMDKEKNNKPGSAFVRSLIEHKALTVRCAVYLLLAIVCYYVQYAVSISESYGQIRYVRQLFALASGIFLILFLIALKRLTPKNLILNRIRAISAALGITGAFHSIVKKLQKIFGLPEYERIGGRDRKSFVFRSDARRKDRRQEAPEKRRWRDMHDAPEKIRYIYYKLMRTRIRGGYIYDPVKTPREHCRIIKDGRELESFIGTYCNARYSGGTAPVTDSEVESAVLLISKNGKIS